MKKCIFCNNFEKRISNSAIEVVPKFFLGSRLIFGQTDNLILTADLFPIVNDPYFLIVPKKHFLSFSNLKKEFDVEIEILLKRIKLFYGEDSEFVFFEHGEMAGRKSKINSVYHAHLHVILTKNNFFDKIMLWLKNNSISFELKKESQENFIYKVKKTTQKKPYLVFSQNSSFLYISPKSISKNQSQFFRRLIANFISKNGTFISWKKMNDDEKKIIMSRLEKLPKEMLVR